MILPGISDKENCCGCRGCVEICPVGAIDFIKDKRGFEYPNIDDTKCTQCDRCLRVCPTLYHAKIESEVEQAVVCVHKDKNVCFCSSSGGAYTAICAAWKEKYPDTYYCGVEWNDCFEAVHSIYNEYEDIRNFCKSKYLMSNTNGVFNKIKELLNRDKAIIFSGTPCQNAALKNYLGKDYKKLLLLDIVCHGAPNSFLFRQCLDELEKKRGEIERWDFRDKEEYHGKINSRSARAAYKDGMCEHYEIPDSSFLKMYYNRLAYRPSCGVCKYANKERISDITIGDAHHISDIYPELDVEKGVSEILFHTKKGLSLYNEIESAMTFYPIDYKWAIRHNQQLHKPTLIHENTSKMYSLLDEGKTMDETITICMKRGLLKKIKIKLNDFVDLKKCDK